MLLSEIAGKTSSLFPKLIIRPLRDVQAHCSLVAE